MNRIIIAGLISGLLMGCTGGSITPPKTPVTPIVNPKNPEYNLEGRVSLLFKLFANQAHAETLSVQKKLSDLSSEVTLCDSNSQSKCAVLVQMSENNDVLTEKDSIVISVTTVDPVTSKFNFSLNQKLGSKEVYKILVLKAGFMIDEAGKSSASREMALLGSEANDALSDSNHQVLEVDAVESLLSNIKMDKIKNALSSDLDVLSAIAKDVKISGRDLLHKLTKAYQASSGSDESDNVTLDLLLSEVNFKTLIDSKIRVELEKGSSDQDPVRLAKEIKMIKQTSALIHDEKMSLKDVDSETGLPTKAEAETISRLSDDEKRSYLDSAIPSSVLLRKEFGAFVKDYTIKTTQLSEIMNNLSPKITCTVDNPAVRCAAQVKAYSDCLVATAGQSSMGMPLCFMEQMTSMMCQTMPHDQVCTMDEPSAEYSSAKIQYDNMMETGAMKGREFRAKSLTLSNFLSKILSSEGLNYENEILNQYPEYLNSSPESTSLPIFDVDMNMNQSFMGNEFVD